MTNVGVAPPVTQSNVATPYWASVLGPVVAVPARRNVTFVPAVIVMLELELL